MSFQYSAPGKLQEFDASGSQAWHDYVRKLMRSSASPPPPSVVVNGGSRNQFFVEADSGLDVDAVEKTVGWTAFPRNVEISTASDEERWKTAESSRQWQEEYCEWSVRRDDNGKIRQIAFTCEDFNYWEHLWDQDQALVLELYRQYISPEVQLSELHDANMKYVPTNKWNRNSVNGAMHMIAGPNTIGAAIELVAAACVIRLNPDGSPKTGDREVTACGKFADPERHSDPSIYGAVNELARAKHFVSMRNAPELAFELISFGGWELPGGRNPNDFWNFTRGADGHFVRGELSVPEAEGFDIGQIRIDGENIRYGAQVADKIRVKVTGIAHRLGEAKTEPVKGCTMRAKQQPFVGLSPPAEHLKSMR